MSPPYPKKKMMVGVGGGVLETEGVPQLVDARQIDDRVAEQRSAFAIGRCRRLTRYIRPDIHSGAATAAHEQWSHFAVLAPPGPTK